MNSNEPTWGELAMMIVWYTIVFMLLLWAVSVGIQWLAR